MYFICNKKYTSCILYLIITKLIYNTNNNKNITTTYLKGKTEWNRNDLEKEIIGRERNSQRKEKEN